MSTYRKQLNQFFAKTFKGWYIEVTSPKKFLLDCGVPDLPIVVTPSTLSKKIIKHQIEKEHLENLNTCINKPLIVYCSATIKGAFNIVIEKYNHEGLLCVSLHPNKEISKLIVNEVATISGRSLNQLTKWAEDGLLIDANVDKIKKVLIGSQFNSAKSEYLISLLDNAKIDKNFNKKQMLGIETFIKREKKREITKFETTVNLLKSKMKMAKSKL